MQNGKLSPKYEARIIQKHCRGVIARNYVRLVQARLNDAEMQRELNGIQMRSVMKIVSKMRLFVKRKRAERQKQRKMLAEIVVRKAKARNDRVNRQSKMLQGISEQAAKRALQMRQAKRFINNTDQVNHIDKDKANQKKCAKTRKQPCAASLRKNLFICGSSQQRDARLKQEAQRQIYTRCKMRQKRLK